MRGQAIFWTGIFAGPVAWFIHLEASFALASLACSGRGKVSLYLVSAISLVVAAFGASICFTQWSAPERRSLAFAGISLNAFFILVIIAQSIPNLLLRGCE